jgi:hypothetical protein
VDDIEVCEVIWQHGEDLTMTTPSTATAAKKIELHLTHGSQQLVLEQANATISLGRDAGCQFVLADRKASRVHARIERRRDKFFLIDQSTNGTFVTFAGEAEIALRREEATGTAVGDLDLHRLDPRIERLGFARRIGLRGRASLQREHRTSRSNGFQFAQELLVERVVTTP